MIHNPIDVAEIIHQSGWTDRDKREVALAVCWAESRFNDQAQLDNTTLVPPGKGIDRGPWQINSFWHAEVSDACAFDLICSTKEARRIYKDNGNTFNPWSAFKNGRYLAFMPEAEIAVEAQIRLRALAKAKDTEKQAIQDQVDTLTVQLELMRAARLAAEAQVEALTVQVTTLTAQVASVSAQLVNAKDTITGKDTQIAGLTTTLNSQVAKLETAKRNLTDLHIQESIQVFGG